VPGAKSFEVKSTERIPRSTHGRHDGLTSVERVGEPITGNFYECSVAVVTNPQFSKAQRSHGCLGSIDLAQRSEGDWCSVGQT